VEISSSLIDILNSENLNFISAVKGQLSDLSSLSDPFLDWLMVEHYQFSARNTGFLATAADVAQKLTNGEIELELRRNLAEENNHAAMYKRALADIGVNVGDRVDFPPTPYFFYRISDLIGGDPSRMLGAMYATETAAIFEHEVFRDISKEVIARRQLTSEGKGLKYFHDMHLSGVEQSHKDELGIFMVGMTIDERAASKGAIDAALALEGGRSTIDAMRQWWQDLLSQISEARIAA
jgi:hypothetical protein